MRELYRFIQKEWIKKGTLAGIAVLRVFYALLLLMASEILRQATRAIETGNGESLKWVAVEAVLVTVAYIVANYCYRVGNQRYKNEMERVFQCRLMEKSYELEKIKFSDYSIGDILTRATQNIPEAVKNTLETLFSYAEGGVVILSGAIYMLVLEWRLALLVILFNILFRLGTIFYDRKIQEATGEGIAIAKRNNSFLMDFLQNDLIIRVFGRQQYFMDQLKKREQEDRINGNRQFGLYNSYSELQWMSKCLANLFILYGFGGYLVAKGELDFSVILAFTMATDYFAKGIMTWMEGLVCQNQALPNIRSVTEFFMLGGERKCGIPSGGRLKENTQEQPTPLLELRDVSFSFGKKKILDHVNLKIGEGEWIQIIGPNGEGKSTLLQILAGIYHPQEGKVLYRGEDISVIGRRKLSEEYVYITQHPHILEDDVWGNLALSETVDRERAKEILSMVRLEKVGMSNPQTYSQGEKQRLCIGRALYHLKSQSMLLGDEIFSNIDIENREYIASLIGRYGQKKTLLFVCHESMGIPFKRTIYVQNGTVTELEGEVAK